MIFLSLEDKARAVIPDMDLLKLDKSDGVT